MKRGAYSLRRSARRVESQAGSATPPALVGSMAAAVFLPPSPHPHPRLGQRVLASSINSRLAKHFTRFQRAAARSSSTSSSTSSSNRTPQYTTYLWISMILSTDAHTLYAPPPVVAANALPNKFVICMRPCTRAHYAHIRARVMNSTLVSHPPNGCCSRHSRRLTCAVASKVSAVSFVTVVAVVVLPLLTILNRFPVVVANTQGAACSRACCAQPSPQLHSPFPPQFGNSFNPRTVSAHPAPIK